MTTTQLTVLTENAARRLSEVFSLLSDAGIDIRAHCLVDNGERNAKLRMIVSEPQRAGEILQQQHVAVVENEVIMVETDDKPGGLSRILRMMAAADLRIQYTYTAAGGKPGSAVMVFRFTDNRKAAGILEKKGLTQLAAG